MPAEQQSPIPNNAITNVSADILMDQGLTMFTQKGIAGVQLVNPVAIVVPNDAIKQIAAQITLAEIQMKQAQQVKSLPGNLPLPPGFNANGRKAGG